MLPFLKKNMANVGVIMAKTRTPDAQPDEDSQAPERDAAQRLIDAVHAKDVNGVIDAAKDLMSALQSQPDEMSDESEG